MLLLSVGFLNAQSAWRTYVSPDKSFSVKLPTTAGIQRKIYNEEAKRFFDEAPFENTKFVDAYTIKSVSKDPKANFWISAYRRVKTITDRDFDEEVHIHALVIGGDKEAEDFIKQADVLAGAFHGREYLFERNEAFYRLRFINAKDRIYFLIYHTKNKEEISSEVANKIFESFKPKQ